MKMFSSLRGKSQFALGALTLSLVLLSLSTAALGQRDRRPLPRQWHGDIARFHERDWPLWRGGHWAHARHDGRLGWWWVAGGLWYFYPAPIYPYPNPWEPPTTVLVTPPETVVPAAPPTQYCYYCVASNTYYPYVPTCPSGWQQVPATPGNAATAQPQ